MYVFQTSRKVSFGKECCIIASPRRDVAHLSALQGTTHIPPPPHKAGLFMPFNIKSNHYCTIVEKSYDDLLFPFQILIPLNSQGWLLYEIASPFCCRSIKGSASRFCPGCLEEDEERKLQGCWSRK